nr:hypothetical protein [Tanacetum cinerariifolium]
VDRPLASGRVEHEAGRCVAVDGAAGGRSCPGQGVGERVASIDVGCHQLTGIVRCCRIFRDALSIVASHRRVVDRCHVNGDGRGVGVGVAVGHGVAEGHQTVDVFGRGEDHVAVGVHDHGADLVVGAVEHIRRC